MMRKNLFFGVLFLFSLSLNALEREKELVGWWRFDEGEGNIVKDSSGNDNHGKTHKATWSKGKSGCGLEFHGAGSDSYVEIPDSESLDITGPFRIEFWWKKESDDLQILFNKGVWISKASTYNYYAFYQAGFRFSICETGGGGGGSLNALPVPNGWHHLEFGYDTACMRIRVDGKEHAKTMVKDFTPNVNDTPLYIGNHNPGYPQPLVGLIDEFKIHTSLPRELMQRIAGIVSSFEQYRQTAEEMRKLPPYREEADRLLSDWQFLSDFLQNKKPSAKQTRLGISKAETLTERSDELQAKYLMEKLLAEE